MSPSTAHTQSPCTLHYSHRNIGLDIIFKFPPVQFISAVCVLFSCIIGSTKDKSVQISTNPFLMQEIIRQLDTVLDYYYHYVMLCAPDRKTYRNACGIPMGCGGYHRFIIYDVRYTVTLVASSRGVVYLILLMFLVYRNGPGIPKGCRQELRHMKLSTGPFQAACT